MPGSFHCRGPDCNPAKLHTKSPVSGTLVRDCTLWHACMMQIPAFDEVVLPLVTQLLTEDAPPLQVSVYLVLMIVTSQHYIM